MTQLKPLLYLLFLFVLKTNYAQTVNLFNGKNLQGWQVHGTEFWYVEDGLLVCESGPDKAYGYLSTEAHYDNFDLSVDFKQEANGNSHLSCEAHTRFGKSTIARKTHWLVSVG